MSCAGIGEFLLAAIGGVGVGLLLMVPLHWLRTHSRKRSSRTRCPS